MGAPRLPVRYRSEQVLAGPLGRAPSSLDAAIALATDRSAVAAARGARLFTPVHAYQPSRLGNPVLSVYQAVDSIIFGTNLPTT